MIHQVGTNGVMKLHLEGDFQLGADTVHARYQHRLAVLWGEGKQASKTTDVAQYALVKGLVGKVLDALLGAIGTINVHPRIGVGKCGGFRLRLLSHEGSPFVDDGRYLTVGAGGPEAAHFSMVQQIVAVCGNLAGSRVHARERAASKTGDQSTGILQWLM